LTDHAERGILTSGEFVIINSKESFASKPFDERLRLGKQCEAQMFENLRTCGYFIREATTYQDKYDKIDGFLSGDGIDFYPFQSKYRQTGSDIGFDVYEPWFGLGDPKTRLGRDYRGKAHLYVTQVNDQLYVMSDSGLKLLINDVLKEWKETGLKFDFGDGISRGTFNSRTFSGVQLKLKIDEHSHTPKIMAYIPPTAVNSDHCRIFTVKPISL
jgi:hypothetical protein